ncbi:hypothetical protein CKV26_08965, partial [Campylobacter jejuni]|nr:hypothetical protein [Campylobacter jejuni]
MQPKSIILFFYGYILFFRRHLLYAQRTGISKEDELFNNLTADFKLSKPFDYQIAFFKHNEIYHCFLAPVYKLKKSRFCFPEPLIFQALFDERFIE